MAYYRAQPMGRSDIRSIARNFRRLLGIENNLYVNVVKLLEHVMPTLFDDFTYEIVPNNELPKGRHADTDVVNRVIRLREDIYYTACDGNGQARMTIMHEIAHHLLIVVIGVKFARSFADEHIKTYEDPEWQAMALAGEIMCDAKLIKHMSPEQIMQSCGVSWAAANQAHKTCHK